MANIYLIGPMGSGKTAVGKRLATLLARPFYDSDSEIEKRTGVDIPFIFEKEGEARFRVREREVIAELTALEDAVVATGGGAVLDATTRQRLQRTGTVVYLDATVDAQLKRTQLTHHRPLLMGNDPRGVLERLAAVRRPLYEEIADIRIETSDQYVNAIAARVRQTLAERAAGTDCPTSGAGKS